MVKKKELDEYTRKEIMHQLLIGVNKKGKPKHGLMGELAKKYDIHWKTISRLWGTVTSQQKEGSTLDPKSKKFGRKTTKLIPFDEEKFKALEKTKKTSQLAVANAMGVSQTTVWRWKRKKHIRKHTNAIKPLLTDKNKFDRLFFCICSCIYDHVSDAFKFSDMSNIVHVDEKLFYLTRTQQTYYLTPGEVEPHREIQSKRFIPKLMFMCAVAKPIYSTEGEVIFDGKIGIFPFVDQVPAQRTSKNRKKGELETKPIQNITKTHIRSMLIDKILPAIREKWPENASKTIYIQQDNAKPHISDTDPIFREAASLNGFNIHLIQQPPNSPDMNVLDLGFFRSIQSLQHKKAAYNYTQLVGAVTSAFEALEVKTLKYVWITLQACKREVLKHHGGIDYHIPHMQKNRLAREGLLPEYLTVQKELMYDSLRQMDASHLQVALEYLGIEDQPTFHQPTQVAAVQTTEEPSSTEIPATTQNNTNEGQSQQQQPKQEPTATTQTAITNEGQIQQQQQPKQEPTAETQTAITNEGQIQQHQQPKQEPTAETSTKNIKSNTNIKPEAE